MRCPDHKFIPGSLGDVHLTLYLILILIGGFRGGQGETMPSQNDFCLSKPKLTVVVFGKLLMKFLVAFKTNVLNV